MANEHQIVLWLAFAAIGVIILSSLARRVQGVLHDLLLENVENQREWLKKKAKATHMIRLAARKKAKEEAAFLASQQATIAQAEKVAEQMSAVETLVQASEAAGQPVDSGANS